MKEPRETQYGWTKLGGWPNQESEYKFLKDYRSWFNSRNLPKEAGGRPRTRSIHPSWVNYVAHFDPSDPTRSQGAFCRWAGIRSSSLSAAKNKPITDKIELKLSEWIEELEKLGHE